MQILTSPISYAAAATAVVAQTQPCPTAPCQQTHGVRTLTPARESLETTASPVTPLTLQRCAKGKGAVVPKGDRRQTGRRQAAVAVAAAAAAAAAAPQPPAGALLEGATLPAAGDTPCRRISPPQFVQAARPGRCGGKHKKGVRMGERHGSNTQNQRTGPDPVDCRAGTAGCGL